MAVVHRVGFGSLFDRHFDGGSFASISGTGPVRIAPVKHYDGNWAWWAVRTQALAGLTPTFQIAKADHYNMASGERLCCWATAEDTDDWHDFDNVTIGATDLEFSNDAAFPPGPIWIAALPMYPFSRVQRKVGAWLADPRVSDTASGTSGVIGTATPRAAPDGSGRTAPALPFYGFKLTGARVGSKNKAILSAFSHATETPGPYQLEGALDWLLGGSAQANTLLDWFEFYVYPCINPQGVWAGWFRSSPEQPTHSHDWWWDGSDGQECIAAFSAAFAADTGGSIDVGLDYHSWMSNTDIMGAVHTGHTGGLNAVFAAEMAALDADFNLQEVDCTLNCAYYQYHSVLGADVYVTVEHGGKLARGVTSYKANGMNSMRALYEMLIDGRFPYVP